MSTAPSPRQFSRRPRLRGAIPGARLRTGALRAPVVETGMVMDPITFGAWRRRYTRRGVPVSASCDGRRS